MLSASSSSVEPISWKIDTKRTKKSESSMPTGSWLSSHCGLRRGSAAAPVGQRVGRGARVRSPHDHLVRRGQEQRVRVEPDDVLAAAEAAAGAQVVLEQQRLLDPLDAVDRLEQLGDRRGVEVGVERPAGAVRARR